MTESLSWALERAALVKPTKTAVIDGDVVLSYAELARRVGGLGGGLGSIGVGRGDVVGVLALNDHRHLEYWLGVPAMGAVLNDLNYRLSDDELAFIVEDCATSVLAVDDAFLELARRLRRQPAYRVRPLRRVSVRGYDHLQPWLVRRRPDADEDNPFESMLDELADDVLDEDEHDD